MTILIPVHNGSQSIEKVVTRLLESLECRIILVDDGSRDETWFVCRRLAEHHDVRAYRLDRQRGQQSAIMAGLSQVDNGPVVTMDDDGAHPIDGVSELLQALEEGADLVYGQPRKKNRHFWRNLASALHQGQFRLFLGAPRGIHVGSFRALSPSLVRRLLEAPMPMPYVSAQSFALRPKIHAVMLESPPWSSNSPGRFRLKDLVILEWRLAWHFGPLSRLVSWKSGPSAGNIAVSWIQESAQ